MNAEFYVDLNQYSLQWFQPLVKLIYFLSIPPCLYLSFCLFLQAVEDTPSISLPHSVQDIMNRWVLQMGFPVVTVDTRTGQVSQQHFLNDPQAVVERESPFK